MLVAVLWAIALTLIFFAIRLPTPALYIYIKDRYVVVSKRLLLTVTLLAVVVLLLIVTARRMR